IVSGLSTSPYDQDKMVSGEARLIRSAVSPLVSTGSSPSRRKLFPRTYPCTASNVLMTETNPVRSIFFSKATNGTNKSKRFENFLQSACDVMLVLFHPTRLLYAE